MTATLDKKPDAPKPKPAKRPDDFSVVESATGLGYNTPQKAGRALWAPMLAMALMGWAVGFILAIVKAGTDRTDIDQLQTLTHLVPAFMFIGFLGMFSAITFAVARILGTFRKGGGEVQQITGVVVQTLRMPLTARAMLGLMMMGMMTIGFGVVGHFVVAGAVDDPLDSEKWAVALEGFRRIGVAMYLAGIALGLAAIVHVLRFQATRIREVAELQGHSH